MTNILDELLEMNEEVNEEDLVQFSVVEKRSLGDDHELGLLGMVARNSSDSLRVRGQCRLEVWGCMSGVMERGIRHVATPGDIYR